MSRDVAAWEMQARDQQPWDLSRVQITQSLNHSLRIKQITLPEFAAQLSSPPPP